MRCPERSWFKRTGPWLPIAAIAGIGITAVLACAQTATNVPVRTFEIPKRVDVVCLQVFDLNSPDPTNPIPIPPIPVPQASCAPVPIDVDGSKLPYHLYAMVTQTARGEVAVVDLTYGTVIDLDRSTPGINFLPVGANPTDLAVTPDAVMTFVAAAEVNKPAIYAIPSKDILGDSQGLPPALSPPVATLPSWPVCSLPQAPGSITVVPRKVGAAASGDAGASSTSTNSPESAYDVVVVLPGDARSTAKIVTLDPTPFYRGAGIDATSGPKVPPGALQPCVIKSAIELSGALPAEFFPGKPWDDGVKYVDGGVTAPLPASDSICSNNIATAGAGTLADAGAGAADAGARDAASDDGGEPFNSGTPLQPRGGAAVLDGQILYVADGQVPVIHVIDLTSPDSPRELAPLLATSQLDPARRVAVGDIAVSPPTSDYRRFLYAIDKKDGSVMIYEITDIPGPNAFAPRVPQTRPHPELNPFQPPDRILFNTPAAAVSFVRHDFAYAPPSTTNVAAKSGLICNPNPNVDPATDTTGQGPFIGGDVGLGAQYRANVTATNSIIALGPARLRGIFAFVTLTNGEVIAIDVDDWDAPCRRPDPMNTANPPSAIAPAQPAPSSATDFDPYHVPVAFVPAVATSPVTLESFFPVSAPHRPRSLYLLENNPTTGNHAPALTGQPQIFNGSAGASGGTVTALLLPTVTKLADPAYITNPTEPNPANQNNTNSDSLSSPVLGATPAIRFSWEDPQVHLGQDWIVTYEGVLPGFDGLNTAITSTQQAPEIPYQTLTLGLPQALFCRKGIEDYRLGTARATAELAAMAAAKMPSVPRLDHITADYIQLDEEILPDTDPYWSITDNDCWDDLATASPEQKQNSCLQNFGYVTDQNVSRDFPILEAYDDHLIIGRYGYTAGAPSTQSREVVDARQANNDEKLNTGKFLRRMQCCFHRQVQFHVRTGGEWNTQGSAVGFLHHIEADANGACVQSCSEREALLNGRSTTVPIPATAAGIAGLVLPDRNSTLAMRNPMFSFVTWGNGTQVRDLVWKFSTTGQFSPLLISIAASTTAVSPQSMRFIDSLGQLAVVDGSSQGLVLIDLNTITLAHTPYF